MKIVKNRPFKATVKVVYPGDDAGSDSFVGHFVALDRNALKELKLGTIEAEDAYIDMIFKGWEGLVDSEDAPFGVTPENRAALLSDMAIRQAIIATYTTELAGLRRGN
ncbi:hypothetical protein GCM10010873_16560 [Cypionkella aquatica]|uniref:Phage protein n=1 Tax=Cypionkella aquatica TaxID=1756042 RepID=A0AA37TYG1_9RHOB|nr:hypothetical protein [Cypionkella aquatica]GLS86682.1 hypothetical protein GCM10010873_16560 [Cypionkella aquatica]